MATTDTVSNQQNKIHPHKFTLWVAIASIIMMFAGLTSAYLVKGSLPGWTRIELPRFFYVSTAVLLASSVTFQVALKAFRERERMRYRYMVLATLVLGAVFVVLQVLAFRQLYAAGVKMEGSGSGQFLYIIFGLHALHVLGGWVALLVLFLKSISTKVRNYDAVPVEVTATYWHFVDVLWVYLFIFFLLEF